MNASAATAAAAQPLKRRQQQQQQHQHHHHHHHHNNNNNNNATTKVLLGPLTHVTAPSFPQNSAHATALALSMKTASPFSLVNLKPLSSPLKIKSFYSPFCEKLEILSLSPLLLKLEGFLDGPTCRSLISAAYQRGFSAEESGCHGDDHEHEQEMVEGEEDGEEGKEGKEEEEEMCSVRHQDDEQRSGERGERGELDEQEQESPLGEEEESSNTASQRRSNATRTSTACWLRKYDYETLRSGGTGEEEWKEEGVEEGTASAPHMIPYEERAAFVNTENKISKLSTFPVSHQEPLQVVRYFPGQQFIPHMDWIDEYVHEPHGGRAITVLIYLQAPKEGGATTFPKLEKEVPAMQGTALFWYNCHPTSDARNDVTVDERLLHAGEPVVAGEKIVAVTWVHPFDATELRER